LGTIQVVVETGIPFSKSGKQMNIENLAHEIALLSNDSIQRLATELVNIFPTRADKLALTIQAVMQDQLRAIETELGLHG